MTQYTVGQVVKGTQAPSECPSGFYWRKTVGLDEFKLYPKKARKVAGATAIQDSEEEQTRLTINRVAAGVRYYMQHAEGFRRVIDAANLSAKALQNLSMWANAAAVTKAEKEKIRSAAVSKANAALKDAGLMIGLDGTVKPITTA